MAALLVGARAVAQTAGQPANAAQAVVFLVAPNGNDSWSGRSSEVNAAQTDGPFATIERARDAARGVAAGTPRKIVVLDGRYFIEKPLVLTHEDSGLVLEAAPGARAALYGGRRVTGWQRDGERFWAASLPEAAGRTWDFRCLVVNGRFCPRARVPKEGVFEHLSAFDVPWMSTTGGGWKRKPTEEELTALKYRPEDIEPWLDIHNAELTIYHMWDESLVGVASTDAQSHVLRFSNPAGHPPGAFGVKKYVVWNVREGMTEPGQWYLDRTAGKVVYWPLPGEDVAAAEVFAPKVESIIRIQGTKDRPAKDITVRGLTLSVTNTPLKAGGFGAGAFEGAVTAVLAEGCCLRDLTIVNVGGQGIKTWEFNRSRIENCTVHHTGACGIMPQGNGSTVANNLIHDVGLTYPSAIGLSGGGQGLEIGHNEIHDTPYTAVCCCGDNHRIEANLVYHAMRELHDGAGIYITFCKNVVVRGNFIRDITDTGGYGASAYYLDEQAENCTVEGNLALRVGWPSHNHMAKNNTIRNNVFIADGDVKITFPKSSNYVFEKNVVSAKGGISISNPAAITAFRDNALFSGTGKVEGVKLDNYSPSGVEPVRADGGNVFADPLIAEFEGGTVRFAPESPAAQLGIAPIDVHAAGRRRSE